MAVLPLTEVPVFDGLWEKDIIWLTGGNGVGGSRRNFRQGIYSVAVAGGAEAAAARPGGGYRGAVYGGAVGRKHPPADNLSRPLGEDIINALDREGKIITAGTDRGQIIPGVRSPRPTQVEVMV